MRTVLGLERGRINCPRTRGALVALAVERVRKRAIPFYGNTRARLKYWTTGPFPTSGSGTGQVPADYGKGIQITESENHPSWRAARRQSFSGDVGGNFFTQKRYAYCGATHPSRLEGTIVIPPASTSNAQYVGPIFPWYPGTLVWPPYIFSSDQTLDAWGAKAIAACSPTNSVADFSNMMGELVKDGIPSLTGAVLNGWRKGTQRALERSHSTAKGASSDFLNAQFGWLPIANDIGKFYRAVYNADLLYQQYLRDAGRMVRRRYEFPPEVSREAVVVGTNANPVIFASHSALYNNNTNKGTVTRLRVSERRRWFSGGFTYHLPEGYNPTDERTMKMLKAQKVFGAELSPELIWNLAPWSWAADWFGNVGDVLSNLSDYKSDGLVLRYGYMMEHTKVTDTYVYSGPTGFQSVSTAVPPLVLVSETKMRRRATPFGFGLTWGGLSPRQLAIAAALGISRS